MEPGLPTGNVQQVCSVGPAAGEGAGQTPGGRGGWEGRGGAAPPPRRASWEEPEVVDQGPGRGGSPAPHPRRGGEGVTFGTPGCRGPPFTPYSCLGVGAAGVLPPDSAEGEPEGLGALAAALSAPPTTPGAAGRPDPQRGPSEPPAPGEVRPLPPPCTSLPPLQEVSRLQQHLDVHPNRRRHSAPGAGAAGPTPTATGSPPDTRDPLRTRQSGAPRASRATTLAGRGRGPLSWAPPTP